jgi:hypothetical protein
LRRAKNFPRVSPNAGCRARNLVATWLEGRLRQASGSAAYRDTAPDPPPAAQRRAASEVEHRMPARTRTLVSAAFPQRAPTTCRRRRLTTGGRGQASGGTGRRASRGVWAAAC